MQKIVVTYFIHGGYECGSYETIECLEYESVEAFYIHFEQKIKDYILSLKEFNKLNTIFGEKYNEIDRECTKLLKKVQLAGKDREEPLAKLDKEQKEITKFYKTKPHSPEDEFVFNNIEFRASDFITSDNNEEPVIEMPEIKTLDEWFDSKTKGGEI